MLRYRVKVELSVEYLLDSCLPFWTTKLYDNEVKKEKIALESTRQSSVSDSGVKIRRREYEGLGQWYLATMLSDIIFIL